MSLSRVVHETVRPTRPGRNTVDNSAAAATASEVIAPLLEKDQQQEGTEESKCIRYPYLTAICGLLVLFIAAVVIVALYAGRVL